MREYIVRWEIDIDADNAEAAAAQALEIMRDPESQATIFKVMDRVTSVTVVLDASDPDIMLTDQPGV